MMKNESKEEILMYENIIAVKDSSKEFIPYWESVLKIIFNNIKATIITSNHQNNEKNFKSLNIEMKELENIKDKNDSLLQIDVYRIKDEKELKNDIFIKKIKENYNSNNINIFLLTVSDNDKFGKVCTKIFNKIKDKINISDMFIIPFNKKKTDEDLFKSFFETLKRKFQESFNQKLQNIYSNILSIIHESEYIKNENLMYDYLNKKNQLVNYYLFFNFWKDIKIISDIDIFKNYDCLKKNFEFKAPLNFINDDIIKENFHNLLSEKKLSNIDNQLYNYYLYIKYCQILKEYNDLMIFIKKLTRNINIYEFNFETSLYFYTWKIIFLRNIFQYIQYLKDNYLLYETEDINKIFIEGKIDIYIQFKNTLKRFASFIKYEIPNEKIFKYALNKNQQELSNEMEKLIISQQEIINTNEDYNLLLNDLKSNKTFKDTHFENYLDLKSFLIEYLNLLDNIDNYCKKELKLTYFSFKIIIEKIPILLLINKYDDIKNILINILKDEEKIGIKWNFIYEYCNFFLIILLNILDKSDETLEILLSHLYKKITRIKDLIKMIENNNENLINNIVSNYISSYQINSKEKTYKIIFNNILDLNQEKEDEYNIIYLNNSKIKYKDINIIITNNSGYLFNINNIKLIFKELYLEKEENSIEYLITENDLTLKEIKPYEKNIQSKLPIKLNDTDNLFKKNSIYQLIEIQLNLKNGILGSYKIENGLKLNVKSLDIEVISSITPCFDSPELKEGKFFYNILSLLNMIFKNFPSTEELSDKILKIEITEFKSNRDKRKENQINIQKNILEEFFTSKNIKLNITKNSIEFPPNSINDTSIFSNLNIPFYIENTNYFEEEEKIIKITTSILKEEEKIYSFIQFHNIKLTHLFHLKNKYRLMPNNSYIMQITFSLNIEIDGIKIYMNNTNKSIISLDMMQAMNIVLVFKNDLKEIEKECEKNFFKFSIDDNNNKTYFYKLCYPKTGIIEDIKKLMGIPYHIIIDFDIQNEHKVFQEFDINVKIKKYSDKNIIFLAKINDNENWGIIGKSKIILNLDSNEKEGEIKFKLFPLLDGYIKIPEIEFMDYEIKNNENDKFKVENYSGVEFSDIDNSSIIEGNERIMKINSINEYTLRLNLT